MADRLAVAMTAVGRAMRDVPGCDLYAVGRDNTDADAIRIIELWSDQDSAAAALTMQSSMDFSITDVLALLDKRPEVIEFTPLGGAGVPE